MCGSGAERVLVCRSLFHMAVCAEVGFVLLLGHGQLITGGVTAQQKATTTADPLHREKVKNTAIKRGTKRICVCGKGREMVN